MAQIGKEHAQPFDELHALVSRIHMSGNMLAHLWARDHFRTAEQEAQHRKDVRSYEHVFWQGPDDALQPELDAVIAKIEGTCRRVIAGGRYGELLRKLKLI